MILAIDPGLCSGWSTFDSRGKLTACGISEDTRTAFLAVASEVSHVVIELPQVYRGRSSKGDPNDLITLAVQVGRYIERLDVGPRQVEKVLPHAWKGTLPKEIHHPRIYAALDLVEQSIVHEAGLAMAASKRHNMMDAVGLGQWYAQRLRRR